MIAGIRPWQVGVPRPTDAQLDEVERILLHTEGRGGTPSRPAILRVIQAWFLAAAHEPDPRSCDCPCHDVVQPGLVPCAACSHGGTTDDV